jgi:hypothetical protein
MSTRVKQYLLHTWNRTWRSKVEQWLSKSVALVVLVGFLGFVWTVMEPLLPSITRSFPPAFDNPMVGQILLGTLEIMFYWSGVATIFEDRRDSQSLAQLIATRPLRTIGWWFLVAWGAIGVGTLVIVIGITVLKFRVFTIDWWQTPVVGGFLLIVLVAIIDTAYANLYS